MTLKCFTICLFFVVNSSIGQSIVDSLEIPVEIRTSRSYNKGVVTLNRSQFLSNPATFDDPSRLLIKYPGISTQNDQANFVIYHGLPSQYHQWQLYGARILNPNHLSNAGTIGDNPSRSSGGVNMMSGQVIGQMQFFGNPSAKSLNSLAGNSDIKLRNPYQSTINTNLSLIGLEVGLDKILNDENTKNILFNYRYSTVGLLTDLGLDFGGEVIKYQDFTAKYSVETKHSGNFNLYALYGNSSNNKDTISPKNIFKDYEETVYKKNSLITGINHQYKFNPDKSLTTTINASLSNEERVSSEHFTGFENDKLGTLKEKLISLTSKFQKTSIASDFAINITSYYIVSSYESYFSDNELLSSGITAIGGHSFINKSRVESTILANYITEKGQKYNMDVSMGFLHNTATKIYPIGSISLSSNISQDLTVSLDYALSRQELQPEYDLYYSYSDLEQNHFGSHSITLPITYKNLTLSPFYNRVFNVAYTVDGTVHSQLENLNALPVIWTFPGFGDIDDYQFINTRANIYGVDIFHHTTIENVDVFTSLTLMNGKQDVGSEKLNIPFNFSHIANIRLNKKWKVNRYRYLGISASFHHRGGSYQSHVDVNLSKEFGSTFYSNQNAYSLRLANYWRADLRIFYAVQIGKYKSSISLDIQNVTNRENDGYYYYEPVKGTSQLNKQLGLLPILSWRLSL